MGLYHVGQAGLKLLTLGDLPALASESAGITQYPQCWAVCKDSWSQNVRELIIVEAGCQYIGFIMHSLAVIDRNSHNN